MKCVLALSVVILAGCGASSNSEPEKAVYDLAPDHEASSVAEWVETGVYVAPKVYMVRSKTHTNMYWLAVRLIGPGMKNTWATFAQGGSSMDKKSASNIFAADAMAKEFSDAVDGCGENKSGACALGNAEAEALISFAKAVDPDDTQYLAGETPIAGQAKPRG